MSTPKIRQRLRRSRRQQTQLLQQLLAVPALLRGSFSRVFTRCGKPNCWCARADQGHAHARIIWSEAGRLITRKVPANQVDQIRQLTANYRRFRRLRRALDTADAQLGEWLDQYEQQQIVKLRKRLTFLAVPRENAGRKRSDVQKTKPMQKDRPLQ